MKKAIVILGGGLVNDHGVWRTTGFNEGDMHGALGDRLRVEAAYILYNKNPEMILIASGGKGQNAGIPHAPAVAEIVKKELVELGIPESSIFTEERSGNTWQALQELKTLINHDNLSEVSLISNRYHLPRIHALINKDDALKGLLEEKPIILISAEEILIEHDPKKWRKVIDDAYRASGMQNRIAKEKQGVFQIQTGTYKL